MERSTSEDGRQYLRTVTMTVKDWDRFSEAFAWLTQFREHWQGCDSIRCYRAAEDPTQICIVEYWESAEAVAAAYAKLGDAPFEFMRRAGEPEFGADKAWVLTDLPFHDAGAADDRG